MTTRQSSSDTRVGQRLSTPFGLRLINWALPITLFLIATAYEISEHGLELNEPFNPNLVAEIVFFGICGPIAVALAIGYIRRLLEADIQVRVQLEAFNRELESRVAERTATLKQRNVELARANTELKQLDQMKSDFVALVSHELRAPLAALNGGLELALQQAGTLPSATRRTLEVIARESDRLTRFVQSILDLSRLEAGKLALTLGPVAVLPLLQRAVEAVLPDGHRWVQWNVPHELPPLWADETYLEEIICNLVNNADKYSPPDRPISVAARLLEGGVELSVTDHGPGVPLESHERIFERLQRGQTAENSIPGWGLGLYFARKLAEAQGGRVILRSPVYAEVGALGAEFALSLPIAEGPDESSDGRNPAD